MKLLKAYFIQGFKNNTVYKINYIMGLIGAFVKLFITVAIWKALYSGNDSIDGISFDMLTTNFIIAIGLESVFSFNDFAVQSKVNDGSIAMEFIKPVDYRINLLATEIGNILFRLITNFIPIFVLATILLGIKRPASATCLILFMISIVLGFVILWAISFIVKMTTFWILNVWSVSVLKGVLISAFSGVALPIWFLPENVIRILKYTPFQSIYFYPIQIYLGNIGYDDVAKIYFNQLIWIVILFVWGNTMWLKGRKRLIVQGG